MNKRKQFGLTLAGVGAGVVGIGLLTNTVDAVMVVSSSILVAAGVLTYVWKGKKETRD